MEIATITNAAATSAVNGPIVAALIGTGSTLLVLFVKERFLDPLKERQARAQSEADVYRQYLGPLSAVCEKIVWRSNEIFVQQRHSFLKTATLPLDFNAYKRQSTLYRIATLIGWVRGMYLELSALPHRSSQFIAPISEQIAAFQEALADGPHVERHRLERLSSIWNINLSALSDEQQRALAGRFEIELHRLAGEKLRDDQNYLRQLPRAKKIELCNKLSVFVSSSVKAKAVTAAVISETVEQAVAALTYREALLYRDWQDAIGDAMLQDDKDAARRYKIIGYEAFGELLKSDKPWFKVLATSIDDIDFDEIDPSDFRSKQLKDVAKAVAEILIQISNAEDERFLVNARTLQTAKALLETTR